MYPGCSTCNDPQHHFPGCLTCNDSKHNHPECSECLNSLHAFPDCAECGDQNHAFPNCSTCEVPSWIFPDCRVPGNVRNLSTMHIQWSAKKSCMLEFPSLLLYTNSKCRAQQLQLNFPLQTKQKLICSCLWLDNTINVDNVNKTLQYKL